MFRFIFKNGSPSEIMRLPEFPIGTCARDLDFTSPRLGPQDWFQFDWVGHEHN